MFKRLSKKFGTPLTVSAGFGLALAVGASAVAISPAASAAVAPLITAVTCSSSSACVSGKNTSSGPGVAGTSAKGTGVNGTSTSSYGLFGTSTSGVGVKAVSKTSSAIFATNDASNYATVNVLQTGNGNALQGTADGSGYGVYGLSTDGTGGVFENNGGNYALFAYADKSNGYMIGAQNKATGGFFSVDPQSNVRAASFISEGSGIRADHTTSDGRRVTSYAAESSSATIEDFGNGRLTNGVAVVPLEHTFRQTIDARSGYSVFLTAGGDNRGLYVVKSLNSFTIHEAQGGRSTLAFDYRIVAKPADVTSLHLPAAAPLRRPAFAAPGQVR